ncbi:hypothetical protein [Endozoicomonas numazuensis]|nr:hypothetical protein [Endozoicomonas numazuensis]
MMKGKPLHDFKALSEAVLEDNRAVRGLIYQEKCHLRSESGEKEFPLAIRPFYYTDFAYVPKTGVLATWHNAEHPHPQGHDKLPYDIVRMSMYIWGAEEDKGLNVKLMLSNYKFEKVLDRVYFCEFGKGIELFRTP